MAAIDFPNTPTNGQLYTNPSTGIVYSYSATYSAWQAAANSTVGYTGSTGFTGSIGSLGYTGSIGYTGSVGFTGSFGGTGFTGSIGSTGFIGSSGFTGSQGTGFTGSQGIGYTGSIGDTGYTGSGGTGFVGSIGFTGSIGYTGSSAQYLSANALSQSFTGDGSSTVFNLSTSVSNANNILVTLDGLVQVPSIHYTIIGTTLTFISSPLNTSVIEVRNLESGTGGYSATVTSDSINPFLLMGA